MSPFRSVEFDVSCIAPSTDCAEGDFVLRRGKYFELGEYPDKEFSLSESEADEALLSFTGAPINLEHTPTLFDGKLGRIKRIWREGRDLLAEYAIPAWLHAVTGGAPLRISSEWDRATKRPIGAALVLSPRIQDAVMMRDTDTAIGSRQSAIENQDCVNTGDKESHIVPSIADCRLPTACIVGPNRAGKESRPMSLLAKFTAFLRGEGLIDESDGESGGGESGGGGDGESVSAIPIPLPNPSHQGRGQCSNTESDRDRREEGETGRQGEGEKRGPAPSSSLRFANTAEYRQMSQKLTEQEAVIAELKADFVREYDKAAYISNLGEINELVRQGKMTAGESEQWRQVAADHPAAFTAVLETLKARPVMPQFAEHTTRRISPNPEAPAGKLIALSKERAARTGERYEAAFSRVCRENPELAAAHAAAAPSYGGGA